MVLLFGETLLFAAPCSWLTGNVYFVAVSRALIHSRYAEGRIHFVKEIMVLCDEMLAFGANPSTGLIICIGYKIEEGRKNLQVFFLTWYLSASQLLM